MPEADLIEAFFVPLVTFVHAKLVEVVVKVACTLAPLQSALAKAETVTRHAVAQVQPTHGWPCRPWNRFSSCE